MKLENVFNELDSALTVSDLDGKIIYMNSKAMETFKRFGGPALVGKSLYDCHQEKSNSKMKEMLASGKGNIYSIEKEGVHKLIYQMPWKQDGKVMGLMEFSIVMPAEVPHFIR